MTADDAKRRTKRRYAHELYPHGDEWEVRKLEVDVPYLYARAIGSDVWGTGWFKAEPELSGTRTMNLLDARHIALMADAMHQGLTGQEAWEWVESRMRDESGELVGERAMHYGIEGHKIKPYPCGPEPDHHDHTGPADARGWRTVTRVDGKESECEECTEPVEEAA